MNQSTISERMQELAISLDTLAEKSRLDRRIVDVIVQGRYTTSPQQRQRIADALGVSPDAIQWSGSAAVDHMYGHGPQFGRSP